MEQKTINNKIEEGHYSVHWLRKPFHIFSFSHREYIKFSTKFGMLTLWLLILLLSLLEIKRYYNIDVIPGYNSSVDDAYGYTRGGIINFLD